MTIERTLIVDATTVNMKITRMAHELYERHHKSKEIFLVGIKGQGMDLAQRIGRELSQISPLEVHVETISLIKSNPSNKEISFSSERSALKGKTVVLIDDVLNSGRTLIHAAGFLIEAELKQMSIATLVERSHRRFPVKAGIVGLTISTNLKEHISVELTKGKEGIYLEA